MSSLHPLPTQPPSIPWPTEAWPRPSDDDDALSAFEPFFAADAAERFGPTHALLAVQRGRLIAERYGPDHDAQSTLPSWSMAKSMLQAVIGILVRDGLLDLDAPPDVPAWQASDDPRRAITHDQLLRMSSGLAFHESYEPDRASDVVEMLFGSGKDDVAKFAEAFPLEVPPDTWWSYSSGTSIILSAIVHRALGLRGEAHREFLMRELFEPLGMRSCVPKYDPAQTWIASSYNFATARDFARFGLLYLRDGVWDGRRILPAGWVDRARTVTPHSNGWYGSHFWRAQDGSARFSCNGFRCQYILMDPERDLIVVRSGDTADRQKGALWRALADFIESRPLLD